MARVTAAVTAVYLRFVVEEGAAAGAAILAVTAMTGMQQPSAGWMRSGHLEVTCSSRHLTVAVISCSVELVWGVTAGMATWQHPKPRQCHQVQSRRANVSVSRISTRQRIGSAVQVTRLWNRRTKQGALAQWPSKG